MLYEVITGSSESSAVDREGSLYQVSTITALLSGIYDGDVNVGNVAEHGDFGLGTFDGIDGEMVVYDGVVYQVRYDGNVTVAHESTGVPFASVHHFISDRNGSLGAVASYQALEEALNEDTECRNYPRITSYNVCYTKLLRCVSRLMHATPSSARSIMASLERLNTTSR